MCFFSSVLLQLGANTEAQDQEGWTPLHAAVYWGQREACEVLAMHRCKMDAKDFMVRNVKEVGPQRGLDSVHIPKQIAS